LVNKIRKNAEQIIRYEEEGIEGADVVVVAYGITSRVARKAMAMARERGVKVGLFRMITCWPFPERRIRELASRVKAFVMPELNYGQMVLEVERVAAGRAPAVLVPHGGGEVHDPEVIAAAIVAAAQATAKGVPGEANHE
jgi:2-oxoglutarate ferredoxin oxidoreductase subunit alpha